MDSAWIPGRESADISERESIFIFFDHLVFYLLECEDQLPSSVIRHSQLTDSIAHVVSLFIRRLISTRRSFQEIQRLLRQSENRVLGYLAQLCRYLVPFEPRSCLIFLANVCLIYICYPNNREFRQRVVESLMMFLYWRRDRIVTQVDRAAREMLENGDFGLGLELID